MAELTHMSLPHSQHQVVHRCVSRGAVVCCDMVAAVLGRLKPNKSPGDDGLHPRVGLLVEQKNQMSTPLPPSWKEANVAPIYKKGKRHIPGKYRPVSLTSMAGKCVERLIRDAIMRHDPERPPITETARLHPGTILRHTAASRTGLLDASSGRGRGGKHRHHLS